MVTTAAAALLPAATYFPLEPGNTWTYRNNATGHAFTVRVGLPDAINGKSYYPLQGYVDSDVMVRIDERNVLVYLNSDASQELPLLSFVPMDGWWNAPYRACVQESQTQAKRGTYDGPAGEFLDVLEVRFRSLSCADAGTEVEQFSENIGMLRRVEQSIAGRRQYDLAYARIGSMIVNALPNGSFSVTLDRASGADQITAVLRLRLNGMPLQLTFPTAQEFDLVLRDESGNIVWTWSEGRFFDQAVHQRNVSVEWTEAVPIPRPGKPASPPEPGNYTLQAWLTTDGPVPRYAATVPVTIFPPAAQ